MNLKESTHLILRLAAGVLILCGEVIHGSDKATATTAIEKHSIADWLKIARDDTKAQRDWESAHPDDAALLLGAGHWVVRMYGRFPDAAFPDAAFTQEAPEFTAWWKAKGAAGMEQWAKEDFPVIMDPEHLIDNVVALYCARNTPRTSKTLFVNGHSFSNPAKLWAYYDRIMKSGNEAYRRAFLEQELTRADFNLLRLYAPIVYSIWGDPYLPFSKGLTPGDINYSPAEGTMPADFTLPRLERVLEKPSFTNAYSFEYERPFHSEIAAFLLYVCNGYAPVPAGEQKPGGPLIKARPYDGPFRESCVTLSASRGKKPVMIVLNDPIDGYWASVIPQFEPLYQATKSKIDWYFICDQIVDNIFWNVIYFPPNQGRQLMQKGLSLEERARIAKNSLCMEYSNLSFPVLLDDMAEHAENAFNNEGGDVKTVLIDKNGVVAMNDRLYPEPQNYMEQGPWGYQKLTEAHCIVAANIKPLLDNNGIWNGKPAVVPDWAPPARLENVKIAKVDSSTGTIVVPGADGKEFVIKVDGGTRIVFGAEPDVHKSLSDLAVGTVITCTYETDASGTGHIARFILNMKPGESFNDFLTWPKGLAKAWCPAVVTAMSGSTITASLVARTKSEMRSLKYWAEPGAAPMTWEAKTVKDWIDNPKQTLTLHTDRATEIIFNGMKAELEDIRVGDHLGVETRADQTNDDLRPFFIYVYRF